jgi:hypothetical protein
MLKTKTSQVPVAHAYNPSYSVDRNQDDRSSRPAWAYLENIEHKKRTGKVAYVVQHLPSNPEVLSLNTSTTKKQNKHILGTHKWPG